MAGTGSYTYGDSTIRESLWDDIKDLDPIELWVASTAEVIEVGQKVHAWLQDPMPLVTAGAGTLELADTSYTGTTPELMLNSTQIIEYGFAVPASSMNSKHAGFQDKFAREQLKAMKKWKQNLELSAVAGTMVTGTGTAARTMQGFPRFATLTTGHSGVSLTSDMLNGFLRNAWTAGGDHDTVLASPTLKSRISSFTNGNVRNVAAAEAATVGRVDVYDSDFGRVDIVLHRYANNLAANTYEVLVTYIRDYVQLGFLDQPHYEDRAITGYYKPGSVVGEATAQLANRLAGQLVRGLL